MGSIKKIYAYYIEKKKGCFYTATFLGKDGQKIIDITETPRFWLLFSKNVQRAIAKTRLMPVMNRKKRA